MATVFLAVVRGGRHLLVFQFGGETGIHTLDLASGEDRLLVPGLASGMEYMAPEIFLYEQGPLAMAQRFDPGTMELVGDPLPVERDLWTLAGSASGAISFLRGGELFFLSGEGLMAVDTRLDRASPAGTPQFLFSLRGEHQLNNYAVTPEGDRILAIVPGEEREGGAATVVLNWVSGIDPGR